MRIINWVQRNSLTFYAEFTRKDVCFPHANHDMLCLPISLGILDESYEIPVTNLLRDRQPHGTSPKFLSEKKFLYFLKKHTLSLHLIFYCVVWQEITLHDRKLPTHLLFCHGDKAVVQNEDPNFLIRHNRQRYKHTLQVSCALSP